MHGVIEESGRRPGLTTFGAVPTWPARSVSPGFRLKSCSSSFSRKPVPGATSLLPYESSIV
jgi:hypothetical protein